MRRAGRALLVVVGSLVLGGCSPDSLSYKSVYDQPILFSTAGPVAVEVESFSGDVSIDTNPEDPYISVRVRRSAMHGYGRADDAKASLAHIYYTTNLERVDSQLVLKVKTWTDDPEPHFLRADMRIRMPQLSSVSIVTSGGKVEAYDFDGEVNVQTSDGRVRLETRAPIVKPVTVLNVRGDIRYQVGGGSSGNFDCESLGGDVDARIRIGRLIILKGTDADTFLATLDEGENPVQLHTTEGDINIAVENIAPQIGAGMYYR